MGILKEKGARSFIKVVGAFLSTVLIFSAIVLSSCGGDSSDIYAITREEGSGTRSAFAELVGLVNEDGSDAISSSAEVTNNTAVMMTSVAGNESAIGYMSLGSLDDSIKAVDIDGVSATKENVKNGSYKIKRPFNIVRKASISKVAQVFIDYILSSDGQKIIADEGYIENESAKKFDNPSVSGKLTIGGSSSVSPVMEKLIEAYKKVNPKVNIELQTSDSSTGIEQATNGTLDIGMASRDLKPEEKGLKQVTICQDGIAVIVNIANELSSLTIDQVRDIFNGTITKFSDIK